jgi:hypothetical protein
MQKCPVRVRKETAKIEVGFENGLFGKTVQASFEIGRFGKASGADGAENVFGGRWVVETANEFGRGVQIFIIRSRSDGCPACGIRFNRGAGP